VSDLLWFRIAEAGVFHIVRFADQSVTLCGIDVVDGALEVREDLGGQSHRPCDNCAEILARHEDAGDQPELVTA
jgi:hypothetical protein